MGSKVSVLYWSRNDEPDETEKATDELCEVELKEEGELMDSTNLKTDYWGNQRF
ncbi:hypothetical protein [Spirosoma sp. KNUC1025]|uniref:hypothetical protein n=1 Tax=Spirosoma sp. KNUC1025 TaxID=2894082 RepID=UPI003869C3EA|nr:hypothetical protein LN737_00415 [Spirosoma sp. KNUC1025]